MDIFQSKENLRFPYFTQNKLNLEASVTFRTVALQTPKRSILNGLICMPYFYGSSIELR
jgi:hypothetical protein